MNQQGSHAPETGQSCDGRRPKVVCIGACHLDRKARVLAPIIAAASNPARLEVGLGGVARNVAENLCRLSADVALVSRVGDDADGRTALDLLRSLPLGIAHITTSATAATAFHLIVLEPDGEMSVGVADMRIYDEITPDLLQGLPADLWRADAVFADCNLPPDSLGFVAAQTKGSSAFAVNGVSPAKVVRAKAILPAIDYLFVNQLEATVLAEDKVAESEPEILALALMALGVGEVVLTLGGAGLMVAAAGQHRHLESPNRPLRDVTGAGDALAAAYLEARLRGLGPEAAGRRALAAARLTLESPQSVSPALSPERLERLAP